MQSGRRLSLTLVTVLATLGAVASSQAAPAAKPKSDGATVSELLVIPEKMASELDVIARKQCLEVKKEPSTPPAKLVSSFPAQGATVRPGLLIVRLTFDRPMTCNGFLKRDIDLPDPCPDTHQQFRQSADRLTVWTVCVARPGHRFGVWLNKPVFDDDGTGFSDFQNKGAQFESLAGWPVQPYRLVFSTSDGPLVDNIEDALRQDPETARHLRH
ncbi:hypothetical protein [Phenylobacterium sp.]|jgi:hypothetical protein|uniref:hypothetical protein n=1 Tax=Phenylobacterium sp. TaxID=1871053 RepID=UPI002F416EA3